MREALATFPQPTERRVFATQIPLLDQIAYFFRESGLGRLHVQTLIKDRGNAIQRVRVFDAGDPTKDISPFWQIANKAFQEEQILERRGARAGKIKRVVSRLINEQVLSIRGQLA